MVSLKSLIMWSSEDQNIVTWSVAAEEEVDEGENVHQIIAVRHKGEIHRFSPNVTDEELQRFAAQTNLEKQ